MTTSVKGIFAARNRLYFLFYIHTEELPRYNFETSIFAATTVCTKTVPAFPEMTIHARLFWTINKSLNQFIRSCNPLHDRALTPKFFLRDMWSPFTGLVLAKINVMKHKKLGVMFLVM